MGKVSTEESRNEISSSPGPPSVVANATIFTFHTFNQENKYPPIHLKCGSSRANSSGGSTPLSRSQPYLRLTPYHTSLRSKSFFSVPSLLRVKSFSVLLCVLCALPSVFSVLNPFLSSLRPLC